jgi:hypothetical protein
MNDDCSFLTDSMLASLEPPAIGCPVGPRLSLRLRVDFFAGSGAGASPRFIARLSFCSSFFWRVEVGFCLGIIKVDRDIPYHISYMVTMIVSTIIDQRSCLEIRQRKRELEGQRDDGELIDGMISWCQWIQVWDGRVAS